MVYFFILSDSPLASEPDFTWWRSSHQFQPDKALDAKVPGAGFGFSQPIELRTAEIIAGVRSDIAIKLFGDDLDVLVRKAPEIARVVARVRGAEDVKVEQVAGLPQLQIRIDRAAIARYGLNVEDVNNVVESIVAGKEVGQIYEGEQRFGLVVRLSETAGGNIEAIKGLLVTAPNGCSSSCRSRSF